MRKIVLCFLLIIVAFCGFSQVISSCIAHDSIVAEYKADAQQLALRRVYAENLPYKDSITIWPQHTDTILKALLAVYNAVTIPARDTVVNFYDIHTFNRLVMNRINVAADSSKPWMVQLKTGNHATGDSLIDSAITRYQLKKDGYLKLSTYDIVRFKSDSNYNTLALSKYFETFPDVIYAEPSTIAGDGNDITDSIYSDHIILIYSIGYGDCPSGCIHRRYWKFRINLDCSVQFVGSYGSPPATHQYKPLQLQQIICTGQSYLMGDSAYSGTGIFTLKNSAGHDSVRLDLTVLPLSATSVTATICSGDAYSFAGNIYSTAGFYYDTLRNINSCDSIVTLNLSVTNIDTSINYNDTSFISNAVNASYQWINCLTGEVLDSSQQFKPSATGTYRVAVTQNNCIDTSSCYSFIISNTQNLTDEIAITLQPNPANDYVILNVNDNTIGGWLQIIDITGRLVYTKQISERNNTIKTVDFTNGIYIVRIANKQGHTTTRRLVIN